MAGFSKMVLEILKIFILGIIGSHVDIEDLNLNWHDWQQAYFE